MEEEREPMQAPAPDSSEEHASEVSAGHCSPRLALAGLMVGMAMVLSAYVVTLATSTRSSSLRSPALGQEVSMQATHRNSSLVHRTHSQKTPDARPRVCTSIQGKDLLGDELDEPLQSLFTGEDAESCQDLCHKTESCGCYSFDPSRDSSCWLKKGPCTELYSWDETDDMTVGICRERRAQVCSEVFGKDVLADELIQDRKNLSYSGTDAISCRSLCEETDGCNCYAFDPSRNSSCWLKTGACDQFYTWPETDDMVSGSCHEERPVFDWPMAMQSDEDGSMIAASALHTDEGSRRQTCTSVFGKDISDAEPLDDDQEGEYKHSSASACRSRCADTQACKCYSFDPSRDKTCWLKRGPCRGEYYTWSETDDMVSGKCQSGRPLLDWPLRATSEDAGLLEKFHVVTGRRENSIGLLSHHGTYVTAQSDGSITVDGDSLGDWESFEEQLLPDGGVALKSFHGGYLRAFGDGGVTADAEEVGQDEIFTLTEGSDDTISLQSRWGKYLTAVRLGAAANVVVRGDREKVGSWATFILRAMPAETIVDVRRVQQESDDTDDTEDRGDGHLQQLSDTWIGVSVTLQTYMGTYVSVAEDEVTANVEEAHMDKCAKFGLARGGRDGSMAIRTCKGRYLSVKEDGSVVADAFTVTEQEKFFIQMVDSSVFFSTRDLGVAVLGNLTSEGGKAPSESQPQPIVLKAASSGTFLFPVEEKTRISDLVAPAEGTRVTQAMIFTHTCEEAGLLPIAGRGTCESAARKLGLALKDDVGVEIVKDGSVPEGCFAENRSRIKLGISPESSGKGVVYREDRTVLNPICAGSCPKCTPSIPFAPAVVILFYERDLCKMRFLAASLTTHDPHQLIGTVHLVWLSKHSPQEFMGDIDWIRNSIAVSHSVRFHDMSWMFQTSMSGWLVQQVVKLKASGLVEEDYYVVFDAKNALIRDLQPDTFLTPCYQGKIFADTEFQHLPAPVIDWYSASAKALGVDIPDGRKWSASITPVVMHTATVIEMLEYLHESPSPLSLCSGALCGHIKAGATEFTLYYLYVATKTQEECIHHAVPHSPAVSLWRGVSHLDEGAAKHAAEDPEVLLFGGQTGALNDIDAGAGQRIAATLKDIFDNAGLHDPTASNAEGLAACVVGK